MKRIVIYSDPASRTSTSWLDDEFRRALGPGAADIVPVTSRQLLNGEAPLDENTIAFVLPGIVGENSLYYDHIGEKGNDIIRGYVHAGGVFMGLCAGAYYAAAKIEYVPAWAAARERSNGILALFNGTARGPVPGAHINGPAQGAFNGCTTVPALLENGQRADFFYSSGPAFHGVSEETIILARYDTPGALPAVIAEEKGAGLIILSGILPQYGVPENWRMPRNPAHVDRLIGRIQPHEGARKALWDRMAGLIAAHHNFRQFHNL